MKKTMAIFLSRAGTGHKDYVAMGPLHVANLENQGRDDHSIDDLLPLTFSRRIKRHKSLILLHICTQWHRITAGNLNAERYPSVKSVVCGHLATRCTAGFCVGILVALPRDDSVDAPFNKVVHQFGLV